MKCTETNKIDHFISPVVDSVDVDSVDVVSVDVDVDSVVDAVKWYN